MSEAAHDEVSSLWTIIPRVASRLTGDAANGDRAELRRLSFRSPHAPAFWRIVANDLQPVLPKAPPYRDEAERRWAAILAGLAELVGAGLHVPKRRLGEAASEADLHEVRMLKLLRAHGDALLELVRPLAHQFVSKGVPVDWTEVARLVLSDGRADEERVRRDIARNYFSAAQRQTDSKQA